MPTEKQLERKITALEKKLHAQKAQNQKLRLAKQKAGERTKQAKLRARERAEQKIDKLKSEVAAALMTAKIAEDRKAIAERNYGLIHDNPHLNDRSYINELISTIDDHRRKLAAAVNEIAHHKMAERGIWLQGYRVARDIGLLAIKRRYGSEALEELLPQLAAPLELDTDADMSQVFGAKVPLFEQNGEYYTADGKPVIWTSSANMPIAVRSQLPALPHVE